MQLGVNVTHFDNLLSKNGLIYICCENLFGIFLYVYNQQTNCKIQKKTYQRRVLLGWVNLLCKPEVILNITKIIIFEYFLTYSGPFLVQKMQGTVFSLDKRILKVYIYLQILPFPRVTPAPTLNVNITSLKMSEEAKQALYKKCQVGGMDGHIRVNP